MTDREKDASISYILDSGLVKPQTATWRVREMLSMLGPRFIFWDTSYSLFFTALTLAVTLPFLFLVPSKYSHSAAVGAAPALFLLITVFAETSERSGGLYELKQTCRYTVRQITALRVMCYSAVGVLFTASTAAVMAETANEFLSLFPLCLSSLFLCAVAQFSVLRLIRGKWTVAVISAAWVFVNLAIPYTFLEQWEAFLRGCPAVIGVAAAILSAVALTVQIRKMLMEDKQYAVA